MNPVRQTIHFDKNLIDKDALKVEKGECENVKHETQQLCSVDRPF